MPIEYTRKYRFKPSPLQVICVADASTLRSEEYYRLVWQTLDDLQLSRREFADTLVDILRDIDRSDVELVRNFSLPEFDVTFSDDEDRRWFGEFLAAQPNSNEPRSKSQRVDRLEVLDLAAKYLSPRIFRDVGQIIL